MELYCESIQNLFFEYSYGKNENLAMAVFRYFRNQWDDGEEQNGDDLFHEAFSLQTKILQDKNLEEHEKYALITALFQNKKTFIAIAVLSVYMASGYTPWIIATGSSQAEQIKTRIIESFNDLVKVLHDRGFTQKQTRIFSEILYQDSKMHRYERQTILEKQQNAIKGKNIRCIISFKHYKQLQPLTNILSSDIKTKVLLIIDEAHKNAGYKCLTDEDALQGDESCKYDGLIFQAKTFSKKVIFITATPMKILMLEDQLYTDSVFFKSRHPGYRGPEMFEFHSDIPLHSKKEELTEYVMKTLAKLSISELPRRKHDKLENDDYVPHIVIIHVWKGLDQMRNMYLSHRKDGDMPTIVKESDWVSITFFGEGIRLWSKMLMGIDIIINDRVFPDMGDGEHFFTDVSFHHLFEWLGNNGGVDKFKRIVIYSYDMAWESISFSSHTYPYWHANRIIASGSHNADNTAQLIARLNGIHYDNLTQHVHCSRASKHKGIKEVSFVLEEVVRKITETRKFGNFPVPDIVRNESYFKNRVPQKLLALKKLDETIKLKTCENPNKNKENRLFRKNMAIDIFSSLLPDLYDPIKDRVKKTTEVYSNKNGKYIVIDQNEFNKRTEIYKMLSDVEKLIIDNGRIGKNVDIDWVNKELVKLPKWKRKSLNNIRGIIWTTIRRKESLIRTDVEEKGNFLYWKENGKVYVKLVL